MGSSDYSGGESDSGGSSYSFGGKKDKKDKKDKKEKKDKDKKDKDKDKGKDKEKKDKDKKDKKDHKDKDEKDKDKKDKDKKDKKDKDKHKDDKPSTSYVAPSFPAAAGSSGHGVPGFPNFPSTHGYHNPPLGISHPSPLPPPSGPAPTVIQTPMSFSGPPPSGYRVPLDSNDPNKPFPGNNFKETGPPVSYDLDGSPIFIGSVLLANAVHPCKIGPHLQPPAQVAYGGGEIGHHGRYDLLPFVPDQMEWVPTGHGRIPPGRRPVEGGYEEGGEKLYHALAVINDVKVPGKTGEHLGAANVGFGGAEHSIQQYEILCWKY